MSNPLTLRAGPVLLDYDNGDLRAITVGGLEIVRRIYVVFQDRNWTARPWLISDEVITADDESFEITYTARGTHDAARFAWSARLAGTPAGAVSFTFTGASDKPFLRNRLGLCLLYPVAGFQGRPCTIVSPAGSAHLSVFPDRISPHQPFRDIAAMEFPVTDSCTARVDFSGETFEAEDHRNWSDASYKIYCTPISEPFPVEVLPDQSVSQSVTVSLRGAVPAPIPPSPVVTIHVSPDAVPLPQIGTQLTDTPWTLDEVTAVAALGLGHLMVTIDLREPGAAQRLHAAAELAAATETRLRVRLADGDVDSYAGLRELVTDIAPVVDSWAVIQSEEKVTTAESLGRAREVLGADLPWSAATDLYFTELNREPPGTEGVDWVAFTMNPQVHASDDRTLMQNTATHAIIARAADDLMNGDAEAEPVRIAVGPITLAPRFNPNATDPAQDVSNTALPSSVDARQRDWRGAAWMALSLRSLAMAGTVEAATYFEALGWRGLRERDAGSRDPEAFASQPAEEFPLYRLFAALRGQQEVFPTSSDQPEVADALITRGPGGGRAWLINLDTQERTIRMTGMIETTVDLPPQSITVVDLQRSSE